MSIALLCHRWWWKVEVHQHLSRAASAGGVRHLAQWHGTNAARYQQQQQPRKCSGASSRLHSGTGNAAAGECS